MPINEVDPLYAARHAQWQLMTDLVAGEDAIKSAGETYIKRLSLQNEDEYNAYKDMGYLYNATGRTRNGLAGAVLRKAPTFEVPDQLIPFMDSISIDEMAFPELVMDVIQRLLTTGFFGILSDIQTGKVDGVEGKPIPYLSIYSPFDILKCKTRVVNGRETLFWLALAEVAHEEDPSDSYSTIEVPQIRELFIDDNGGLVVQLWREQETTVGKGRGKKTTKEWSRYEPPVMPTKFGGTRMDVIPFKFYGAVKNSKKPSEPPLLDLGKINIKHYKTSCDYYYGLHIAALPTPYAFGLTTTDKNQRGAVTQLTLGPGRGLTSNNENAKCGYMEFGGQGMGAVRTAMIDLKHEMSVLGARILEESKAMVESAEAINLRGQGDSASLSTIVNSAQEGLKASLTFCCIWLNIQNPKVEVELNKEWVSSKLSPPEIQVLLQALQAGEISQETFLYNLMEGEILPPGTTIEDEISKIELDDEKRMRAMGDSLGLGIVEEEDDPEEKNTSKKGKKPVKE